MISVIIPTYNQRGYLANAIDSVLSQTYKDVEVLVVDDNNPGSEARILTEKLMAAYSNNPKVCYLQHEQNKNGSAARNTGFRESKGEYIAFLDDDDYWAVDKLEKQLAFLKAHRQFDGVYSFTTVNGERNPNRKQEGNLVIPYLMNFISLQTSCLLLTRKAVEGLGGFDERFRRHQDYEFMIRFFASGYLMGCVPEYLSFMNSVGGNRLSGKQLDELKDRFFDVFNAQLDYLEEKQPGVKKRIIVANYVKNFESHVASKQFKLAFRLFVKYFPMSPSVFCSQCYLLFSNHLKRKMSRRT